MHAIHHSLKLFGMLGAVFFAAAPASAQCTYEWLPGNTLPGLDGTVSASAVYDDGSGPALDHLAAQYPEIKVLHFDRNYGQSSAFAAGFREARGELVVTMDGDLQFDPADILALLPYAADYDLVCGWRKNRHDHLVRKLSSKIANAVRSAVTGDRIHDTGCSLKVFRRAVIEQVVLFEGMHRFFPALALMHGFTVTEVPVRHFPRAHGSTKYGIGNRLFKGLYDLVAVRWMKSRILKYRYKEGERPEARG